MQQYSSVLLEKAVGEFAKLPGIGRKTALRLVLHLLRQPASEAEAFADAVIREVREETGLIIEAPQLCGVKDWVNADGSRYLVLFYKTDRFSGELRSSEEGSVFWMELEELLQMDGRLAPDMNAMIQVFLRDDLSEFFYVKENGKWRYVLK